MGKEHIVHTGETIFRLIDARFGSDANFERRANLPPKTVNNWRRGRSSSFMKMLPELAELFDVTVNDLLGEAGNAELVSLTADEQELLAHYRAADALSTEERAALAETLRSTIDLYLSTRRDGSGRR